MSDDLVKRLRDSAWVAAELTRLRGRNAELDKSITWYVDHTNNEIARCNEAESRIAALEATVRGLRAAAMQCKESFTHFLPAVGTFRAVKQKDFDALMAALTASDSVVGNSEGEKDGVE